MADNQASAFLLLDAKSALKDPEYISYMGGYFGSDGNRPVYVFSRLHYLAGVAGLRKDEADPIARVLAARLQVKAPGRSVYNQSPFCAGGTRGNR